MVQLVAREDFGKKGASSIVSSAEHSHRTYHSTISMDHVDPNPGSPLLTHPECLGAFSKFLMINASGAFRLTS